MKSRCVSITGATGFLGQHIADAFHSAGWHVRAIVRPGNVKRVPPAADARESRLLDAGALARAFEGSSVIVHAAGIVRARSASEFEAVNVSGTHAVVDAANAVGARLIHISSLAAAGPATREQPVREEDRPRPVNAYGRSKLAGEYVVGAHARVPWIILRPSAIYGPWDRGFLPVVKMAKRGLFPLAAPGAMPFTFAYVADVADAVLRAAESERSALTLFVGHPQAETTEAMLRGMARQLGRRYRPVPVPDALIRALARVGDLVWVAGGRPLLDSGRYAELSAEGFVCDVSRAQQYLGFTASVALSEGLERTVRWYRDRGWV